MKLAFALILTALTFTSFAQTLDIEAEFSISSEYGDEEQLHESVKKNGWSTKKDSDVYTMKLKVPFSKLPLTKKLGSSFFSVEKSGLVKLGASFGDSDSETVSELNLPIVDGKIAILPAPLTLANSGGEYASGTWSFQGKLIIKTLK